MRKAPDWLSAAAAAFALLEVAEQRAVLDAFAGEIETRSRRMREGVRPEDLGVFDAAAAGLARRARALCDQAAPGAAAFGAEVLEELALDNRGVSVLEAMTLLAMKAAVRVVGIPVRD